MKLLKASLLVAAMAAPIAAHAEATSTSGNGSPLTASARLDFRVTIPKVLLLQVGTDDATINTIEFDLTGAPTSVGDGSAVAGTGGDLGGGRVTARVLGNNGNVTLSSITTGALTNANGDTISYSQIAAVSNNTALAPPALADNATTNTTLTAVNKVVNQTAQWTYSYRNQNVVAPGVYGSGATGNGRVTYTASMP